MNARDIINPIAQAFPMIAVQRGLNRASSGMFGRNLFRTRRRGPGVFAFAAGVALAAAAAALINPSSRKTLRSLFERTGGGVGKQVGKFVGEHAGAHPLKTAELVRGARELVSSGERAPS